MGIEKEDEEPGIMAGPAARYRDRIKSQNLEPPCFRDSRLVILKMEKANEKDSDDCGDNSEENLKRAKEDNTDDCVIIQKKI